MYDEELKRIMEHDPSTARGRNKSEHREIDLGPDLHEIEYATKARADGYVLIARDLADSVRRNRYGITDKELERVEFVREELYHIAQDVLVNMVKKG